MENPFVGNWTYRSLLNDPDLDTGFGDLQFGLGTLVLTQDGAAGLGGTIGGPGWSLDLHGSYGFGSPMQARFQGPGVVGGENWIYDYIGWLVPAWPGSTDAMQRPAIAGSVTRTIAHGSAPAGVVASFYAVRQG
jgi:hypothetical protein